MKTPRGLRALLALLREHGVTEYSAGGVTIRLGQVPPRQPTINELVERDAQAAPPVPEEPQDPRWAAVNELKRQWKASHDG